MPCADSGETSLIELALGLGQRVSVPALVAVGSRLDADDLVAGDVRSTDGAVLAPGDVPRMALALEVLRTGAGGIDEARVLPDRMLVPA